MRTFEHNYPSDITRDQFAVIQLDLESGKKKTKPRDIALYSVFCAILYLVKSGCQWRMIPADYPKQGTVRYYYDVRSEKRKDDTSLLSDVLKKISNNSQKR